MSVKYFCDQCGAEIRASDECRQTPYRVRRIYKRVRVEIIAGVDNMTNAGDICFECIIEAVTKGTPMSSTQEDQEEEEEE